MEPTLFSILIPSWNNLPYLKCCIESIRKNSTFNHEIIVHLNEGTDESETFLRSEKINFTHSDENIGICKSVNKIAMLATTEYIVYMNDDMYVLPEWDLVLKKYIDVRAEKQFMLSSTMIEPLNTGNVCVQIADFGRSVESFDENNLLASYHNNYSLDWNGATWPPIVIPKKLWHQVGGFSEAFSPGMYSDPDLSMKLWKAGCRDFCGVGKSLVYHFMAKSTQKIVKNNGRIQFLKKWKLLSSTFYKYYLKMGSNYKGPLSDPIQSPGLIFHKTRAKILNSFK